MWTAVAVAVVLSLGLAAGAGAENVDPPGTTCDATDVGGVSPACSDPLFPYCRAVTTTTFECRECLTDCDCELNEFCSSKPGDVGVCSDEFQTTKVGQPCQPMTDAQLASSDYKDENKCALTYSENSITFVDHKGGCVEGVCHFCDADIFSQFQLQFSCQAGAGRKSERGCYYPGVMVEGRNGAWAEGYYHSRISAVWAAIVFVFFILVAACQLVQTIFLFMTNGAVLSAGGESASMGGGGSSNVPTSQEPQPAEAAPEAAYEQPAQEEGYGDDAYGDDAAVVPPQFES